MPINKNAYHRYIIIDRCLKNKFIRSTKEELLKRLEDAGLFISSAQLDKDIAGMKNHKKAPIKFDRQSGGYVYTEASYSFENHAINEEDKWLLDFANATMLAYGHSNMNIHFEELVNKLSTGSAVEMSDGISGNKYLQIEETVYKGGYHYLYNLYKAIIERKVYEITYQPFNKNARKHSISPYLLKQYRNRWYLIGYSKEKSKTLVFALDRITELKSSKCTYYYDTAFDAELYFKYSFGITHRYDLKPQKIWLKFSKLNEPYIISQPLHKSQIIIEQSETEITIELEVLLTHELYSMIMSYGNEVEVISPKELRNQVYKALKDAVSKYKSSE
jgi:predicted DNA-binding transcriptional regulator YafY